MEEALENINNDKHEDITCDMMFIIVNLCHAIIIITPPNQACMYLRRGYILYHYLKRKTLETILNHKVQSIKQATKLILL